MPTTLDDRDADRLLADLTAETGLRATELVLALLRSEVARRRPPESVDARRTEATALAAR